MNRAQHILQRQKQIKEGQKLVPTLRYQSFLEDIPTAQILNLLIEDVEARYLPINNVVPTDKYLWLNDAIVTLIVDHHRRYSESIRSFIVQYMIENGFKSGKAENRIWITLP